MQKLICMQNLLIYTHKLLINKLLLSNQEHYIE